MAAWVSVFKDSVINEDRELRQLIEESAGIGIAGFGQQYSNEIKRSESDA
jgi:hypothetical protein